MKRMRRASRRLALAIIAGVSLATARPAPAEAQIPPEIICFLTLGGACLTVTVACDASWIPDDICGDFWDLCIGLTKQICFE